MNKKPSTGLLKSVSTISLFTLVSRISGVVREFFMATMFGASIYADAFNVASRIPNFFRRLFAEGAFSQAFVPVLAASKEQRGEQATKQMIDNVSTLLAWVLLLFSILGVLFSPGLVWLLASGLRQVPESFAVATVLTRWIFPYIAFMSLVALASGILNTWKQFAVPAATPVLYNISMIAAASLLAPYFAKIGILPIYAMAGGVLLGGFTQLVVQLIALKRLQLLPKIGVSWRAIRLALQDPSTRRVLKLMAPALLGVSVAQISLLINTQIASHLPTGSVSWLTFSDRLMELPIALIGVALGVVLTPRLSAAQARKDSLEYSQTLDWGLRLVLLLGLPAAVALFIFAEPMVATLYHYGAFTAVDLRQVSLSTMGYSVGVLGLIAIKVLAAGFYANQDIKTPVKAAIAVLVLTQLMNLLFVPYLAHAGLALSIGIGALLNAAILLHILKQRGWYRPEKAWLVFAARVFAAVVVLALLLLAMLHYVDWAELRSTPWQRLGLMLAIISAAIILYFGSLYLLGLKFKQFLKRQ